MLHLHQKVINMENAPRPDLDVTKRAESFVKKLFRHVPTVSSIWYLGTAIKRLFLIILIVLFVINLFCWYKDKQNFLNKQILQNYDKGH